MGHLGEKLLCKALGTERRWGKRSLMRAKGKGEEVREKLNLNGLGLSVQSSLFPATSLV